MLPEIITYIITVSLATIIPPFVAVPLELTAAARYGLFEALFYTMLGDVLGGLVAFYIGRKLGWKFLNKLFGVEKTKKAKKILEKYGFWKITFGRMALTNIWDVVSFASGLTKITYGQYFLSSIISVFPSTLLIILFGNTINLNYAFTVWTSIGIFIIAVYILIKQFVLNKK